MNNTPPPAPLAQGAPLRCADVRPYLSSYVDGELAEPLRTQVARHVAGCAECAARVESYRETDALLRSLPETSPAPEVFHAVMAAAREQNAEPVEREALASPFAGLATRRLRVVRPEPQQTNAPAALGGSRRKSWVATAMPAVAALLLVTLAALAFRGLITLPKDTNRAATPTVSASILDQTQAQIAAISRTAKLPVAPILPSYVPNGVSSVKVSPYCDDAKTISCLKIEWTATFNPYLRTVIIRETPNSYGGFPGYIQDTSSGRAGWQLRSGRGWQPYRNASVGQLTTGDQPRSLAAGQYRAGDVYITVEVIGTSPASSDVSLTADLRKVTLSMDGDNKLTPLASAQTNGLVLHYTAQSRVIRGETPNWSANVYINPADAQWVEVSANGKPLYVDSSQGSQQGYRLNKQTGAYATGPRSKFSGDMDLANSINRNILQTFSAPGDLFQGGLLWYSGQTAKVGSATAYDYILVSAPNETHVYIDTKSSQVIQLRVDPKARWNSLTTAETTTPVFGKDGCSYFTQIEYIQPEDVPAGTFSLTPPSGSHQDQSNIPPTLKCS